MRWGKREIINLSLHCHHQNDSCIKMGSDESHFNVSVGISDEQSHRTVSTNRSLFENKGEPKRYRTEVLPPYRWAKPAHIHCKASRMGHGRASLPLITYFSSRAPSIWYKPTKAQTLLQKHDKTPAALLCLRCCRLSPKCSWVRRIKASLL